MGSEKCGLVIIVMAKYEDACIIILGGPLKCASLLKW